MTAERQQNGFLKTSIPAKVEMPDVQRIKEDKMALELTTCFSLKVHSVFCEHFLSWQRTFPEIGACYRIDSTVEVCSQNVLIKLFPTECLQ